jgi:hypothetical protein
VALDDGLLLVGKGAVLVEDRLGDGDLADVVEDRAVAQRAQLRLAQPEPLPTARACSTIALEWSAVASRRETAWTASPALGREGTVAPTSTPFDSTMRLL